MYHVSIVLGCDESVVWAESR